MDEKGADDYSRWPDFIPPDFEQPHDAAPDPSHAPDPRPDQGQRPAMRPSSPQAGRWTDRWFHRRPGSRFVSASRRDIPQSHPAMHGRRRFAVARGRPTVTNTLIGICVAVWVAQNLSYQVNDWVTLVPALGAQEPWRFITSAFAHIPRSLTHIGFNMLVLWLLGRTLEPLLGHAKYLAVYLISALGGSALFVVLASPPNVGAGGYGNNWYTGVVGASGAVFGLFGALLMITLVQHGDPKPILILLALNAAMAVLVPGIAWQSHLGGLACGAAATGVLMLDARRPAARGPSLAWPGLAAVTVAIVVALVVKYSLSA